MATARPACATPKLAIKRNYLSPTHRPGSAVHYRESGRCKRCAPMSIEAKSIEVPNHVVVPIHDSRRSLSVIWGPWGNTPSRGMLRRYHAVQRGTTAQTGKGRPTPVATSKPGEKTKFKKAHLWPEPWVPIELKSSWMPPTRLEPGHPDSTVESPASRTNGTKQSGQETQYFPEPRSNHCKKGGWWEKKRRGPPRMLDLANLGNGGSNQRMSVPSGASRSQPSQRGGST